MTIDRDHQLLRRACLQVLGIAAVMAGLSGTASAQTQTETQTEDQQIATSLEEIIVSAQRREQSIQDVPLAVTALSPQEVETRQITETLDLLNQIPNAVAQNNAGPGAANAYYIRGLGSVQSLATFDSPVASYVDDMYVGRQAANNFALFDLERIEVLRGPQGTLFGRNTSGGAVRVILKKPGLESGGYLEAGYGRHDRVTFNGSVNVPATDKLFLKLSGYYIEDDGYVENRTTGEDGINADDNRGVRAAMRWLISDAVTWDLAGDYVDDRDGAELNFDDNGTRFTLSGLPRSGGTMYNPVTKAPLLVGPKNDAPAGSRVKTYSGQSNFAARFGGQRVEFISAYLSTEQDLFIDILNGGANAPGDQVPAFQTSLPAGRRGSYGFKTGGLAFAQYGKSSQFTQEIKLNGLLMGDALNYVAGAYYFNERNTTEMAQVLAVASLNGFPSVLSDFIFDNDTEAYALFGQLDYKLPVGVTLTLGGRYTWEDKTIDFRDLQPAGNISDHTTANLVALGIPTKLESSRFTPRVAVAYASSDTTMWFASATKGFKSGGWNASATAAQQLLPFTDEIALSYEAGVRAELMDRRLRLNVTAFSSDITDAQVLSGQVAPNGAITFVTRNFADMEVSGIELEASAAVTDNLRGYLAFGYQDARYKINYNEPDFDRYGVKSVAAQQRDCLKGIASNCNAGIVTASGAIAEPTRSPSLTTTFGGSYSVPVAALNGLLSINAQLRYFENHPRTSSNPTFSFTGDQTLYDASLAYQSDSGALRVSLGCKNCSDQVYITSTVSSFGWINEPRTWALTARYGFGRR